MFSERYYRELQKTLSYEFYWNCQNKTLAEAKAYQLSRLHSFAKYCLECELIEYHRDIGSVQTIFSKYPTISATPEDTKQFIEEVKPFTFFRSTNN